MGLSMACCVGNDQELNQQRLRVYTVEDHRLTLSGLSQAPLCINYVELKDLEQAYVNFEGLPQKNKVIVTQQGVEHFQGSNLLRERMLDQAKQDGFLNQNYAN